MLKELKSLPSIPGRIKREKQYLVDWRILLLDKTKEKMAAATYDLLLSASVDIEALILGAGEETIARIKQDQS